MNRGGTAAGRARRKRMSSSTPETFRASVLTISDSSARGERADTSGPAVARVLEEHHFTVIESRVVADDHEAIQKAIDYLARKPRLLVPPPETPIPPRTLTPQ